jgi:hypothetical protein
VWERTTKLPPDWKQQKVRFVVLERGRGDYWSLRVHIPNLGKKLWVDAAYYMQQGELAYIGPAGPETRKRLGIQ